MASTQGYTSLRVKFSDNVQATISVKLINGDNEDPADVYGTITGRFSIDNEFGIFDVKQHNHISVRPGEYIPLSGPEVNVPSKATNLEITAYLMDYDTLSPDDEIANGTATFLVKCSGESDSRLINGKYGSVEVTVEWS